MVTAVTDLSKSTNCRIALETSRSVVHKEIRTVRGIGNDGRVPGYFTTRVIDCANRSRCSEGHNISSPVVHVIRIRIAVIQIRRFIDPELNRARGDGVVHELGLLTTACSSRFVHHDVAESV